MAKRKYPIGAEIVKDGVHFRVFAPKVKRVEVALEEDGKDPVFYILEREEGGYFSGVHGVFEEGSHYRFRLDGGEELYADPASRFQPYGPFGPSQVVDASLFEWQDQKWGGTTIANQVIYEMHFGTFTPEGTFAAAQAQLKELAELGVTVLEILPVNEFPGNFGWGYDGVNLFAPTSLYGWPDDLRRFIDEAHRQGLAVILDVVYNHFGPEGNYISCFSDDYLDVEDNEWGRGINFDHPESRLFFLTNIRYWIEEFHFDGLRFDATQSIDSTIGVPILKEMCDVARKAAKDKSIILVGENERQKSILLREWGFDALWNDDFHHSAIVNLTGRREAYYTDYLGHAQEFLSCIKHGFLYQGQFYVWQDNPRGTPCLDLKPFNFVLFLQNHDQIANTGHGERIHQLTDLGRLKAMTCLFLISPGTPMLFQGQEFGASNPFLYFADHAYKLSKQVYKGRKEFLAQFPHLSTKEAVAEIPNPADEEVFLRSKLDFADREKHAAIYTLHKDLLALRRFDPVFSRSDVVFDGAVLSENALVIRFFAKNEDRLLMVNLGPDLILNPAPEPLLAPVAGCMWEIMWSSESVQYGGQGTAPLGDIWKLYGHSALILKTVLCE